MYLDAGGNGQELVDAEPQVVVGDDVDDAQKLLVVLLAQPLFPLLGGQHLETVDPSLLFLDVLVRHEPSQVLNDRRFNVALQVDKFSKEVTNRYDARAQQLSRRRDGLDSEDVAIVKADAGEGLGHVLGRVLCEDDEVAGGLELLALGHLEVDVERAVGEVRKLSELADVDDLRFEAFEIFLGKLSLLRHWLRSLLDL